MGDDLSLFGDDDEAAVPLTRVSAPAPVAGWQVDLLRKALDARGLTSMDERQRCIEAAAGRSVESLRALTDEEGLRVLSRLERPGRVRTDKSTWDEREEDTWIDRL